MVDMVVVGVVVLVLVLVIGSVVGDVVMVVVMVVVVVVEVVVVVLVIGSGRFGSVYSEYILSRHVPTSYATAQSLFSSAYSIAPNRTPSMCSMSSYPVPTVVKVVTRGGSLPGIGCHDRLTNSCSLISRRFSAPAGTVSVTYVSTSSSSTWHMTS